MGAEARRLIELAEAIADGSAVDWRDAASSLDPADADLIRELRLLADVASVHRSLPGARDAGPVVADFVGTTWGNLRIIELLGVGNFGAVYRARDSRLARDVALKLLHHAPDDASTSSIIEEGRLLARARHHNVVSVYGADCFDERVGIWMELIHGRTLEAALNQDGPLGAREAALVGVDLCGALAAIHAEGLVHRDVKTQNVMREAGGRVVLMDFGAGSDLSRASERAIGTPVYMAPELFDGGRASAASDIYSLGVLLFRLVSGQYPVPGQTKRELQMAHVNRERRYLRDLRPSLPAPFVRVVEQALAADPHGRFESAGAMDDALTRTLVPARGWLGGMIDRVGRRTVTAAAALFLLLATMVGVAVWRVPSPTPVSAQGMRSLGIHPLTSLAADPDQIYFAKGLTDLLLSQFGSLRELRVIALPASTSAASDADLSALARRASVDGVLEGSVQRNGGRIRVAARLVSASTGAIVWGRTYDGAEREAFNLQSRIAADVAREIGLTSNGPVTSTERTGDVAPAMMDLYLQGRYWLDLPSRPNLAKARDAFERVVAAEPLYARAHASLALTYLAQAAVGDLSPTDVRALAPTAAHTAYNLDPTLAEAALAIADVRFRLDWDVPGAETAYKRAIFLNPSYVFARGQYVRFLAAAGRTDEALAAAREARRIDPLSGDTFTVVGMALFYARRYDEAIAHYLSWPEPARPALSVGLGRAYAAVGRYPEAIAALTDAVDRSGREASIRAELGRTYAAAGQTNQARAILAELEAVRGQPNVYIAPQDLAYIRLALDEPGIALALLDEAMKESASRLVFLRVDPRVDALRGDPRFEALQSRLYTPR